MGLGRLGGLLLRKSWAADCRALVCGVVGLSGVWCRRHARCGGLLRPCGCGGLLVVGAPACVGVACCRGSGAVRPGCLARVLLLVCGWWGWVWVGWL